MSDGCRVLSDPSAAFDGVCLIAAPHMDDGVLGCGGTVSLLPDKVRIHFVYVTDGTRSPVPPLSGTSNPALKAIRMGETRVALSRLGIPPANAHFLGLPEDRLRSQTARLVELLTQLLARVKPDRVLVPFRYDRHPDHLVVTRSMHQALTRLGSPAAVYEYFVYFKWQLLPQKDVRKHIGHEHVIGIDFGPHAARKREALLSFRSQTTRYFAWQTRPILTEELVAEFCQPPELFVRYDPAFPNLAIFPRLRTWIRLVHACEPRLKNWKDRALHLLTRRQP